MFLAFKFRFQINIPIKEILRAPEVLKMSTYYQGQIAFKENELNLDLTLMGGQSFRWEKQCGEETEWYGVAYGAYWKLKQNPDYLLYKVYTASGAEHWHSDEFYSQLLQRYLRLDFDLNKHFKEWRKSHQHFDKLAEHMRAVRVLDQEPLENLLSFMCSQNNNIKRISSMIQWLCINYGKKIGNFNSQAQYSFPTLDSLIKDQKELESKLRSAKFGYRAKFIAQSIAKINEFGGNEWFKQLRSLPYTEARQELVKLPGIGLKVADCICLMSLNHLESVPIDTHIFKIAQSVYMPQLSSIKAVTPKVYEEIAEHFRKIYGRYAGWTQTVLFCSELQQFQNITRDTKLSKPKKKCSQ